MIDIAMIGAYSGNYVDKDGIKTHTLEPVILLEDFKRNKMQGIQINNRIAYKYWDYTGYFEIKENKISPNDKKILDNLNVADLITFNCGIEEPISSVFYSNDGNIITNIEKYYDPNALSKIRNLAFSKIVRYLFTYKKPVSIEDTNNILNTMYLDNLSPKAIALYILCRNEHSDRDISMEDIRMYASYWVDQDIEKALFELVDLGYLIEDPIYDLIDSKLLPSYLTNFSKNRNLETVEQDKKGNMDSITINPVHTNILETNASPIAVGIYLACLKYNLNGQITQEWIWNGTFWSLQYIARGFEELEKLGYLYKTDEYFVIDGREVDIYDFFENIDNEEAI